MAPVQELHDLDEQTFFEDTALDRAFGVVMALATEVYVLRDRQRALERLLQDNNIIAPGALDGEPTDQEAFTKGLMINLLGKQQSKGAG